MRPLLLCAALLSSWLPARSHPPAPRARAASLSVKEMLAALPPTSGASDGTPDSPVNLLFVGSEAAIRRAIARAAWTEGTASMTRSVAEGLSLLASLRAPDVFPPVSAEYLFGRAQDAAFLRQSTFISSRHHFRLWKAPFRGPNGEQAWAGTANFDAALVFLRRGFVHRIDPEIDRERDYILGTLRNGPDVLLARRIGRRARAGADSNGSAYRTDGGILVMFFRS
ncbi:MAG: LssY C-terminal domain-containing protein [Elusimicrobiota bacterium]